MTQYNNNIITSDNGLIVVQIQTETFVVNTLTIFLQKFNSGGRQKKLVINRSSSGISGKCTFKYRVEKNTTTTKGIETADNLRHKRFRFTAIEGTELSVFLSSRGCAKHWKE